MPDPTMFATGLFGCNALGDEFLAGFTNATSFRGLPIVGCFRDVYGLNAATPGYADLVTFAAAFNAPLVAFDGDASFRTIDPPQQFLLAACRRLGYLFTTSRLHGPVVVDGNVATPVVYGGPLIVVGASPSIIIDGTRFAWNAVTLYSRTSEYHPYVLGMQGVSTFTTSGNFGPPIYVVGPTDIGGDLVTLQKKWQGKTVTTTSQYQLLLDAAADRPGLAALCNAALIPFLSLANPL